MNKKTSSSQQTVQAKTSLEIRAHFVKMLSIKRNHLVELLVAVPITYNNHIECGS